MKMQISPSVMCVDFFELKEAIAVFEQEGIEYIHVDIMDGHFVPNFTLGTDFIKQLKKHTFIPMDIHLMVERPEEKLSWIDFGKGDYIAVHCEATPHLHKALSAIKERGAKAMAVLNPGTPIAALENVLDLLDGVLVMTVNPGFAGQKLIESTLEKITALREYLDKKGYSHVEIECDGNVSFENAKRMKEAGANIFVGGTSSVFSKEATIEENIKKMRAIIK
ncbi:MAG: ribulose-phosphate 3-epimerase [Clostridia bacterium]|nr:ribulose-phosphate 3-epimerase [Clostridia bacterium]